MCIKFELETPLPFEVTSGIQNYPVFRLTLHSQHLVSVLFIVMYSLFHLEEMFYFHVNFFSSILNL